VKRKPILSLGTSNLTWQNFQQRLERHGVDVVLDVRARPYSRHAHFCQPALRAKLNHIGLSYIHLPDLGGLSSDDRRTFSEVATTPPVQAALEMVLHIATRAQPVLVCAEADVLTCHRCLMLAPALKAMGAKVVNILPDGSSEDHSTTEARLMRKLRLSEQHLWKGQDELLAEAYVAQERKIRKLK
jgi:uncharacterized protein (DUF488 family)